MRRLAGACGIAILIGGMVRFSDLTAYFIISVALSFIGRPIVQWIDRINIAGKSPGPGLGAFIALSAIFAAFSLLVNLFVPLVAVEAQVVADLDFQSIAQRIEKELAGFAPLLNTTSSDALTWIDASTSRK